MNLHNHLNDYLDSLKARHYAKEGIKKHGRNVDFFLSWLSSKNLHIRGSISKAVIKDYELYLFHYQKENGQSFTLKARRERLISLRLFLSFLVKSSVILYNPLMDMALPRVSKSLPKEVFTEKEMIKILSLPDITQPLGLRDRTILETLYSTGLRRRELINLSLYDIDPDKGILLVRQGKNQKDRFVPIGERAVFWVQKYLDEVRPKLVSYLTDDTLFLSTTGVKIQLNSLTNLVSDYVNQANINKKGSCHTFRHTMATLMLENGADIRYIQEILGHVELKTTQIYTRVSIGKLHEVYRRSHPSSFRGTA